MDWKENQVVWFHFNYRGWGGSEVTVRKVGRKWVQLSNGYRVDKETGAADGGQYFSPGTAYPSKEDWIRKQRRQEAWTVLRLVIDQTYSIPESVDLQSIEDAATALGLREKFLEKLRERVADAKLV